MGWNRTGLLLLCTALLLVVAVGGAAGETGEVLSDRETTSDDVGVDAPDPAEFIVQIQNTTEPVEGEPLAVTFSVENVGNPSDDKPIELDAGPLGENLTTVTLDGGESTEETLTVGTVDGDAGNYTANVSSPDDFDTVSARVLERAEFVVGINDTVEPVEGDPLAVTASVENVGDVQGDQTVTLDVPGLGTDSSNITLAGGASTAETLSVATADGDAGEYTATVASDDDTASTNTTVLAQAEFLVDIVAVNKPVEGDPINVTFAVENVGDVQGNQTVVLDVGSLGSDSRSLSLASEASTEETLSVDTAAGDAGTYTATVASEDDSDVQSVTVLQTGLFVVDIVDANEPVEGERLDVTASVRNTGDTEDTQTISLFAGTLGSNATNVTVPGGDTTVNETLSLGTGAGDAGNYTATVTSEDDTANASVRVLRPAEFTVSFVNVTEPVEGTDLEATVAVENVGDVNGTQLLDLSVDGLGSDTVVVDLASGESTDKTLAVGTAVGDAGTYTVTASTEDDTASTNATVLARAEFLVDIVDTDEPVEGANLSVTVAVENVGDVQGNQTVALEVPGIGSTNRSVTLSGNQTLQTTVEFRTEDGDAGNYTVTASTEDDAASANVTVLARAAFLVDIAGTSTPVEGETLTVTASIENVGDVTGTQTVGLTVGSLGGNATNVTLGSGESATETLSVDTAEGDAGNYTATVASEDDAASANVTVLAVGSFTVDIVAITEPVEGEDLAVTTLVENTGDVEKTQPLTLDAGGLGANSTNVTLAGGELREETLTVGTADGDAGNYTVTVASEDDADSATVTVLAPAELVVDVVDAPTLVAGEDLAVTATVENVGDVADNQTVTLTVAGLGGDATNVTLGGGESVEETLSVSTAGGDAGNYTATVASADDAASANVTVLVPASFAVDIIATGEPVEGQDLAVTATVENVGDVEGTQTVGLTVDGLGTASANLTLPAGASTDQTFTIGTGGGDDGEYTATVASEDDAVSANLTVLARAEFLVDTASVTSPVEGANLTVTVAVENAGDVTGTQVVALDVPALGTDATNVTLGGGASSNETLSVGTAPGDAGNYTATVTSANDTASANATVLAPAEFTVEILDVESTVEGEPIEVLTLVENVGDVEGTETVALDIDGLGGDATNVTLAGGDSTGVPLSVETDIGDAGNYTATVSSANDTASANVTVLAQAEFLVDIVETSEPVEGEHLAVTIAVENVGGATDTQTLELDAGPLGTNATNVTLTSGESSNETLVVATDAGDAGTYEVTVASGDDAASANVTVLARAEFLIDIVATGEPVEGEDLAVTATVENVGDVGDTQRIELTAGSLGNATANVTLGGDESVEETLVVGTGAGDAGEYTATVASANDTASTNVTVLRPATFEITGVETNAPLIVGETLELNVTVANSGDVAGVQTLAVDAGDLGTNSTELPVEAGQSVTATLVLPTESGQTGEFNATITTGNDTAEETVELGLPAIPGQDPPRDLDDDGRYEDVDGNGKFDIFDVQVFFNNYNGDVVQSHPDAFDFDGNSKVDIFDVQALFGEL